MELANIVKKAQLMISILSGMDDTEQHREIANKLRAHWSVTYIARSDTFHVYLEDYKLCLNVKFVDALSGDYDYIDRNGIALKIKRATTPYKEGASSIVLVFSDYAKGPEYGPRKVEWRLDSLIEFTNIYGKAPYFYF